ncbi:glycerol-3-phosphate acyltransferase [Roseburia sp. 1XD42-34]|nr:glycerol-3-phosphate acyltransferase [Roseburia sp. 1XD42-34]NBJ71154.1 glycerol-3-phosphate acyltransferase [Roseburia sp. 1XD42-34]RKI75107.1 glycerol-3-phosphate acyltransferase [Clostridium sp. 1xD42-85]
MQGIISIAIAYIFGCLNGAYYIGKLYYRKDIRELGSTNAGARNAGRVFSRSAFIFTVVIDAIKVIIPLMIATNILEMDATLIACMAIALLFGHLWPVQLGFRGGKGVVVYLAAALVLAPIPLLVCGVTILIGYQIYKNLRLVAMLGFCTIPVGLLLLDRNMELATTFFIMLTIVAIMHRNGD